MKDAKTNMNRPPLSEKEINDAKDFDALMKMNSEPPFKIKWGRVLGGIAVIAGIVSYFFWPVDNEKNSEIGKEVKTSSVVEVFYAKTSLPYSTFKIDASTADTIVLGSGTKIIIPAKAFKDLNGNDLSGELELKFREFHDVPAIFGSNVNMQYDSAGQSYHFESAGMFELLGEQNGNDIAINKEHPILVELNSKQSGNFYNIYFMDPKKGWQFIRKDTVGVSFLKDSAVLVQPIEIPQEVLKAGEKYDKAKANYQHQLNQSGLLIPQKADNDKFSVKLDYSIKEFPELEGYGNVLFEVNENNKNFDPNWSKETWSDIDISKVKGEGYQMTLYGDKKIKVWVDPVFASVDFEQAENNFEILFEKYDDMHDQILSKSRDEMAEAYLTYTQIKENTMDEVNASLNQQVWNSQLNNKMESVKRVFTVADFGFWNSDCPQSLPQGRMVDPVFVDADHPEDTLEFENLYIAEYNKNAFFTMWGRAGFVITVDENGKEQRIYNAIPFSFNPKNETVIWAITSKGKLAVIKPEDLLSSTNGSKAPGNILKMKLYAEVEEIKEIKKALEWP